ncbi:MAG: DUF58 domain-containing protein [marine benthic group bacterium]|jgi:uncharacterized protein (DUF58 family)|nr:DUF58 domain-containing protein [Gemmatimonadota bacterium]MCL7970079.1 DUF58 domain-containing protein [Gemmatimonadota bacterium]MCL7977935.1 DUF58 domain-containing protein [Gemmatimonadota bacterium]MCL7980051.1 DUF58 domain-containing protein [Gemmatimonadota bacterium]MCL7981834.1 DUF58 domain-containing protein [Gemmatimonadota bacterium]
MAVSGSLTGDGSRSRPDLKNPSEFYDPGRLELIARTVVEGFLIGLHRSPHRGFSVEFAENRPYYPGDDIRFLDWRMYARSDRWYLKQFEEETNLRAYLVLDTSRSMRWSSPVMSGFSKLDYGRLIAASLANLLLRQGDATGFVAYDESVRTHLPPRASRRHLATILRELVALEGDGGSEAGTAIRDVAIRLRRRGLVVLISDLLVDAEGTRRALHFLRHRGHEVIVLHLMDPGERELPAAGDAVFFDPETGEELRTSSAALRAEYAAAVEDAVARWRSECRRMGADYHLLITDTPLGVGLGHFLQKRARLG